MIYMMDFISDEEANVFVASDATQIICRDIFLYYLVTLIYKRNVLL